MIGSYRHTILKQCSIVCQVIMQNLLVQEIALERQPKDSSLLHWHRIPVFLDDILLK